MCAMIIRNDSVAKYSQLVTIQLESRLTSSFSSYKLKHAIIYRHNYLFVYIAVSFVAKVWAIDHTFTANEFINSDRLFLIN